MKYRVVWIFKMRLSLFRPTTNYLLFNNALKSTVFPQIIQQCTLQQGKNSVAASVVVCSKKIFQRSDTTFFNLGSFGNLSASYCTNPEQRIQLMRNFPICSGLKYFKLLKVLINHFAVKVWDREFGLDNFLHNSTKVLKIVTPLLAEGKFSELEGLLTDDCLNEVRYNIENLHMSKRRDLEVKSDSIIRNYPFSLEIIRVPDGDKKRIYVEIIVVFYVIQNSTEFWDIVAGRESFNNLTIYNVKFIREFTPGVDDQWTISAINIHRGVDSDLRP